MQWTLATIVLVAVMAGAAFFVFNEAVKGGSHVVVPNVVGMSIERAQEELVNAGLEIGEQNPINHPGVPEYHVAMQRPSADKVVREGRRVNLIISAGRQQQTAPSLVGQEFQAAQQMLQGVGLAVGHTSRMPSESPANLVLAQYPPMHHTVEEGGAVHLLLSTGTLRQGRLMPDLVGLSFDAARAQLPDLNLNKIPRQEEGAEQGVVLEQSPAAGTILEDGQQVTLVVNEEQTLLAQGQEYRGIAVYVVPNLPGPALVRLVKVDHMGRRSAYWPTEEYASLRVPGQTISIDFPYIEEATIEVYVDDKMHMYYSFQDGRPPVPTPVSSFGSSGTPTQPATTRPGAQPTDTGTPFTAFEPESHRLEDQPARTVPEPDPAENPFITGGRRPQP